MENYFYVVVRTDIAMADQMCQVAHAAADAGRMFCIPADCNLVLLQVKDLAQLEKLAEQLREAELPHTVQDEPDDEMGHTALATAVVSLEQRRLFRKFRLWTA
ncbi:MAG: peptidyl-tRNA hydrolase [Candidatus Obscuribacterales bacterium]|nr:peptidyl-tRNA hydrolase [Candidatus Obscuribacterales bacterium]